MTPAIQQSAEFAATPEALYELYMDSKKHSAVTRHTAKMARKPGASFTAFNGSLAGKNLLIVPNEMIVQAWRSTRWPKSDPDSVLVLTFTKTAKGGRVDLVHVNVPPHDHKDVTMGWKKFYWKPWRKYLATEKKKQSAP